MTTDSDRLPPALRRWAAEQLGVEENATPGEARAAFLARLREANFLPPPAWRSALGLLQHGLPGRWSADDEAARRTWEEALRDEVETYASQFFSLPVDFRQQRWRELLASCELCSPRLSARLIALEGGLRVDATAIPREGSPVGDLARDVMRLFVMRPEERASARLALIVELESNAEQANEAACGLEARYTPLVSLDPALVNHLKESQQRVGRRDALHRRLRSKRRPVVTSSRENNGRSRGLGFAIAIGLFALLRFLTLIGDSARSLHRAPPAPVPSTRDVIPNRTDDRQMQDLLERVKKLKVRAGEGKL